MSKFADLEESLKKIEREMRRPKTYDELNDYEHNRAFLYFADDPGFMEVEDFITLSEFLEGFLFFYDDYDIVFLDALYCLREE